MEIKQESWGFFQEKEVMRYIITDTKSGFLVSVTDLGAHILRVVVPDKNGHPNDITFTSETPEELIGGRAYLGATVGRVANRIAKGEFTLEGAKYNLAINNPPNHIHGGIIGFDQKIWIHKSHEIKDNEVTITFTVESPDMDEGYPGKVVATTKYIISPNKIAWEYEAITDKTTIVNLTNHSYWNLDGTGGIIDNQVIKVEAKEYNSIDENGLNTGILRPASEVGTTALIEFGKIFATFGDVDNNFWLDAAKPWTKNQCVLHACAETYSPKTGREMIIRTTDPCVQLYTANSLTAKGPKGVVESRKHHAFCLETQRPPNAINMASPLREMVILSPNEKYYHKTEHEFRIK